MASRGGRDRRPRRDPRSVRPDRGPCGPDPRPGTRLARDSAQRITTGTTTLQQRVRHLTRENRVPGGTAARRPAPAAGSPTARRPSRSPAPWDARKPWGRSGSRLPGPRVTQVRPAAGLMTQWLLRRTRPAKVTSRSPANRKPRDRQIPFDGLFAVAGNACTSPSGRPRGPAQQAPGRPAWRARVPGTPAGPSRRSRSPAHRHPPRGTTTRPAPPPRPVRPRRGRSS